MIVMAKSLTNGAVPMGVVAVKQSSHDAFMNGPEHLIEFFHGYTCSAQPLACAAALGALATAPRRLRAPPGAAGDQGAGGVLTLACPSGGARRHDGAADVGQWRVLVEGVRA